MLDGLLNRGFSSKCKSLIKPTRTRIEVVRRRAEAKQRFLKEDLAKLLANGLDINAYGRTEEFLSGLDLLTCYDFIEYTCEYVVKQLSIMQKQRECPEECREAIASLMFAAARFSDLPELRDLRDLFQERYGSTLECFVNQKFVEKLSSKPPITEKRLQLLKDIASEFSIKWDSRGFEQRMSAPASVAQAQSNKQGPCTLAADKYNLPNGNGSIAKPETYDVSPKEAIGHSNGGNRLHNSREDKDSRRENGSVAVTRRNRYDVLAKEVGLNNSSDRMHKGREGKDLSREGGSVAVAKSHRYDVSPKETRGLCNDGRRMHNGREGKNSRREELDLDLHQKARHGRSANGNMLPTKKGESTSRLVNDSLFEGRKEVMVDEHESPRKKDNTSFKAVKSGTSSRRKVLDDFGSAYLGQDEETTNIHEGENWEALSHGKPKLSPSCGVFPVTNEKISSAHKHVGEMNLAYSEKTVQEEEVHSVKSSQNALLPPPYVKSKNNVIPPPYVKHKDGKHKPSRKSELAGPYCDGNSEDPSSCNRVNQVNESNRTLREPDNHGHMEQIVGLGRVRDEKEMYYQDDKIPLPKPRSVRRKQHKSSSGRDDITHAEDAGTVKRSSSSRRRENSRKGLQILFDGGQSRKDEEEKMIDKLLLHYSNKPSTYDARKARKLSQAHPAHKVSNDTGESSHGQIRNGSPVVMPSTMRSISLPHEETMSSEAKKVFTRANSFQPDGQAPHVHPKLPDYDDLAARFAALKGQ